MPNILDYLTWRGDLPLCGVPFCDVDYLILARMSYLPFDDVLSDDFSVSVPLGEIARRLLGEADGAFRLKDDRELLTALADSPRFASLPLTGYVNVHDEQKEEQFSAVTALLPDGSAAVTFRGTDGTLVGWKEDFNMALSDAIPAQADAVAYLARAAAALPGGLRLGGHSKGGNLAVYAAAFSAPDVWARVIGVRNFDGPGFSEKTVALPSFREALGRVRTYLPKSSVVGMLLEHAEPFTIVDSRNVSIFQHNVYMWEIERGDFSTVETRTDSSQFLDSAVRESIRRLSPEQREKLVNGVFAILGASGGRELRDLWSGKSTLAILRVAGQDEETRRVLSETLRIFRSAAKSSLPAHMNRVRPAFLEAAKKAES